MGTDFSDFPRHRTDIYPVPRHGTDIYPAGRIRGTIARTLPVSLTFLISGIYSTFFVEAKGKMIEKYIQLELCME